MKNLQTLNTVLKRHGVSDPHDYIERNGMTAKTGPSPDPEVKMRGSVQLMKRRRVSRDAVEKGFSALKYL